MVTPGRRATLRRRLLDWYGTHARDLPWRRDPEPYAVWLSEIMLQQTQVAVMLPHYHRFRERFPTIASLATASEEAVLEAWQGLGYYGRARRLHAAARRIVAEHGGRFPRDPRAALALPGVGRYTAGAILSIAHGIPLPVVDGNVARVLARWQEIEGTLDDAPTRTALWELAAFLVPRRHPGTWNQALMELGATVCTVAAPRCDACPLRESCRARASGRTGELPPARRRRRPPRVEVAVAWIERGGEVLVTRRGERGVLAGFWELPSADVVGDARRAVRAALESGLSAIGIDRFRLGPELARASHAMFNRRAELRLYQVDVGDELMLHAAARAGTDFIDPDASNGRPLTTATRKLVAAVGASAAGESATRATTASGSR